MLSVLPLHILHFNSSIFITSLEMYRKFTGGLCTAISISTILSGLGYCGDINVENNRSFVHVLVETILSRGCLRYKTFTKL